MTETFPGNTDGAKQSTAERLRAALVARQNEELEAKKRAEQADRARTLAAAEESIKKNERAA